MDAPRIGQLIKKLTTQKTQNIKKSSISSILSIIIIIIIIIMIIIIIIIIIICECPVKASSRGDVIHSRLK